MFYGDPNERVCLQTSKFDKVVSSRKICHLPSTVDDTVLKPILQSMYLYCDYGKRVARRITGLDSA